MPSPTFPLRGWWLLLELFTFIPAFCVPFWPNLLVWAQPYPPCSSVHVPPFGWTFIVPPFSSTSWPSLPKSLLRLGWFNFLGFFLCTMGCPFSFTAIFFSLSLLEGRNLWSPFLVWPLLGTFPSNFASLSCGVRWGNVPTFERNGVAVLGRRCFGVCKEGVRLLSACFSVF